MGKPLLCVLVSEEAASTGIKVWVAQTIEFDMATQVSPGDSILDVVEALGNMWDAHDVICTHEGVTDPPPPAPLHVYNQWLKESHLLGRLPLGEKRLAEVRILRSNWNGDESTPVLTLNPLSEIDSMKAQNADLRRQFELWRPIVGAARIVTNRQKSVSSDWSLLADSIEMLGRMIDAADAAERGDNG